MNIQPSKSVHKWMCADMKHLNDMSRLPGHPEDISYELPVPLPCAPWRRPFLLAKTAFLLAKISCSWPRSFSVAKTIFPLTSSPWLRLPSRWLESLFYLAKVLSRGQNFLSINQNLFSLARTPPAPPPHLTALFPL